jgi:OCT family organic cation transporter-like MFS transporter 3
MERGVLIRETSTSNSEDTSEGSADLPVLVCDNKSLIQAKRLYEIDEIYKRIGCRAQVFYALLLAVFGEVFCPFGTLAPFFQTIVPAWECNSTLCNVTDQCGSPRDSWYWVNTHRTLISEFELQCNRNYALLAGALFWIPGMALGLPLGGYLCDKYGRKRTNLVFMAFSALFGAGMGFANSFEMFLVFQCFLGLALGGSITTRIIWILEFFPDSRRPIISAVTVQLFCLGSVMLPVADYYLQDWRCLDWIICICSAICVPVMMLIPESPHWLLTNQRKDEAECLLTKMALSNNKGCCKTFTNRRVSFDINNIKLVCVKKHNESGNILTILRDPKLLVMLLGLLYQWFLASLLYYGFYFMTGSLSGSIHWNFAIMGSMEVREL